PPHRRAGAQRRRRLSRGSPARAPALRENHPRQGPIFTEPRTRPQRQGPAVARAARRSAGLLRGASRGRRWRRGGGAVEREIAAFPVGAASPRLTTEKRATQRTQRTQRSQSRIFFTSFAFFASLR